MLLPSATAVALYAAALLSDNVFMPRLEVAASMRVGISSSSYVAVSAAIAQTLGAFLGLYFTALGMVVGSVYGRVPGAVRALAIREQVGTRYLKLVALSCVFAVLLGAADAVSATPSPSAFVLLIVLTTCSILAFAPLGLRVYHFLDPHLLAGRVNRDVFRAMKQLRSGRPYAKEPSFQAHHRRAVEGALDTYDDLFAVANAAPPNLDSSKVLLTGEIALWFLHTSTKTEIPSGSEWFRPRAEHRSILASDVTSLLPVYLATATLPEPRVGRDALWFDRRIAHTLIANLSVHLTNADLQRPTEVLGALSARFFEAGKVFAVEEALLIEETLSAAIVDRLVNLAEESGVRAGCDPQDTAPVVQLFDFVASAPAQILLGLADRIRSLDPDTFLGVSDWRAWLMRREYYKSRLPRSVTLHLDDLVARLYFERDIEGEVLTPGSHIQERCAAAVLNDVTKLLELLATRVESAFLPAIARAAGGRGGVPAIHVALRGLEACHKFLFHLPRIAEWHATVLQRQVRTATLVTSLDAKALASRVELIEASLYDQVARLAAAVSDLEPTRERMLPDYFGQAYLLLAEQAFKRLREEGTNTEPLVRALFGLSFLAMKRLGSELSDVESIETRFTYVTEPLVTLLDLSGYAYLFAQLHRRGEAWRFVKTLWESVEKERPEIVVAMRTTYEDRGVRIRPWFNLRFEWRRRFQADLAEAVRGRRWLSPAMRVIAARSLEWPVEQIEARNVFLVAHLTWRAGFEDMKLPHEAEALLRDIQEGRYE